MVKILVVDDDPGITEVVRLYLSFDGFDVLIADNGQKAMELFYREEPHLIILDLLLPYISGFDVCRTIRKNSQVPILMLTAKDSTEDKLQGFALGADDYLVKPFDPKEAVARVKALLRRTSGSAVRTKDQASVTVDIYRIGTLEVNLQAYEVRVAGKLISLKPREIQLLNFLLMHPNHVFTREQLLEQVWGYDYAGETRTVDVHIMRLRDKVEGKESPVCIRTVRGVGYKLEVMA